MGSRRARERGRRKGKVGEGKVEEEEVEDGAGPRALEEPK